MCDHLNEVAAAVRAVVASLDFDSLTGSQASAAFAAGAELCGRTAGIQWDHKNPFALGGPTSSENLHPMCGFDNREKEAGRVIETTDGRWVRTANFAGRRNPR